VCVYISRYVCMYTAVGANCNSIDGSGLHASCLDLDNFPTESQNLGTLFMHMCICMSVCTCMGMCMGTCMRMYMCVYICMCICTCM